MPPKKFNKVNEFEDKKKQMAPLPPSLASDAQPPRAAVNSSPRISPRSSPRWGAELPPTLSLLSLEDKDDEPKGDATAEPAQVVSTEESDLAESNAIEDKAPAADLVAMDASQRKEAVDDVLGRLLAENMGDDMEGNKEAAAADLAECVKAFGIQSLWIYAIHPSIKSALEDKNSSGRVEGGLFAICALMRRCTHWFEPYVMGLFPAVLRAYAHKSPKVRDAANAAALATIRGSNPRAARLVLPLLFQSMEAPDWREKQAACVLVGTFSKHASSQLNICMPLIVPRVTTCLRDTKKEVAKAARQALSDACNVIGNPDILPVVPSMIAAMKNPEECPTALEDLMHTTFIHPIDAATLSVIVPILERSLKSRGTMHEKRKAATVIINMCKLVLRPSYVEPFVPKLLPELEKSADDAAFEEIRDVCRTAQQVLLRAMGEAGIAVINKKNKDEAAAAEN